MLPLPIDQPYFSGTFFQTYGSEGDWCNPPPDYNPIQPYKFTTIVGYYVWTSLLLMPF